MDPGTVMVSYYIARIYGVSDPTFQLARPEAPLLERIERLSACFDMLRTQYRAKLVLTSTIWFEEAARVKRKVLANGRNDHSFYEDMCEAIDQEPLLSSTTLKHQMKNDVRKMFLLDDETFVFLVPGTRIPSMPLRSGRVKEMDLVNATLGKYAKEPEGSWKRALFEMRDSILKTLDVRTAILLRKEMRIQLLKFTAGCELWNKKVLPGAPVVPK